MKRLLLFVVLLSVLAVGVVSASPWTTFLTVAGNPDPMLRVDTTATFNSPLSLWTWSYDVTGINILPFPDGVKGFSINLGSPESMLASNISTTAAGWAGFQSSTQVYWQLGDPTNAAERLDVGETFHFQFDHPYGPVEDHSGSAQDTFGFFGPVPGPAVVPEPVSIMLGALGLATVGGIRRMKRK